MAMSKRLRLGDVEGVFELVNECRECWADADAWRHHLLEGVARLTGSAVGIYLERRLAPDQRSVQILDTVDRGWRDADARSQFMRLFADHPDLVQFLPHCVRLAHVACGGQKALRPQISPDRKWCPSRVFDRYHRPAFIDRYVLSYALNRRTDTQVMLCAAQDRDDRAPTWRTKAILALLRSQITPLVGTVLATTRHRGTNGLSPRLRQTLDGLLSGEAEKQIAARLDISRATVHEYVGMLYQHFGVEGRAELMAYFLRRQPAPAGTRAHARHLHPQRHAVRVGAVAVSL